MDEILTRIWEHLGGRVGGPMTFRLLLQPLVASFLAARDGWKDAQTGRSPYFWTILWNPEHRAFLLHEGWKAVAKVFTLAIVIDLVYQWVVFRWIYALEAVIVAVLLAFVPYFLVRGPVNRLARLFRSKN